MTGRALADLIDSSHCSGRSTACLLQYPAVPILAERQRSEYGEALRPWHEGCLDLTQLERHALGWDHAEVGRSLSCEWDLREQLAAVIGTDHGTVEHQDEESPLPAARPAAGLREVDEEPAVELLVEMLDTQYGVARDHVVDLVETSFEAATEIARVFT
jgi:hypothetical protein